MLMRHTTSGTAAIASILSCLFTASADRTRCNRVHNNQAQAQAQAQASSVSAVNWPLTGGPPATMALLFMVAPGGGVPLL